ncbi:MULTISPECIES: protease modulator HflC [unclassified Caballeronia]|uniref:protease modulator HflC n=1 Tax=unclassified Caballeronia TaxID=2646786 RepID=UPI0028665185|nr:MULTISPECIES: protease modulator HflC [unclassified Caballeronia]MDR5813622.1 protease modulator HflC [Caballeronia sp. LZ033]MDR5820378.1 protease modulator HflC [Caballeronia sp. LZ043]MDR5878195.1 protease modulator HflC [Caballeronia sp. LZ032]
MNRIIALVVAVVIVLFIGSSMIFTVDERHAGVVAAHGEGNPRVAGPGLHFKLPPPFQTLTLIDTRTLTIDESGADRFTTADKNEVMVNTVIKYRVADPLKLFESNEKNTQTAQERITALARTALASGFAKRSLTDALGNQQTLASDAQKSVEAAAAAFGVQLVDLQMTRIDFPSAVADSVYKRMIAARQQAAANERAKGTADADKIKADAEREQQQILADAYSQAQSIKGEGDSKAAGIAADAYGRDPQFYQFYQSLEAYKKTFKPGDVMIVDPNSDFFRFMKSPTGGLPDTSAPATAKR